MIHISLDKSLKHFGITGKRLSEESGISQPHISEFRRGKTNLSSDALDNLIQAADRIEPGFKRYFCQLYSGGCGVMPEIAIDNLSSADLARLLIAIGDRLQQSQQVLISA